MKKSIFILLIIILVFLNCFLAFSLYQNKETDRRESNAGNEIAFRLIGDWKVKEYIGSALMARGHFFKEQYLGRSIFIDENTITQTLRVEGWPDELDDYTQAYSDCTIETMLGSDYHYAFENRFVNDTIPFDDENIELIIFRNKYKITQLSHQQSWRECLIYQAN